MKVWELLASAHRTIHVQGEPHHELVHESKEALTDTPAAVVVVAWTPCCSKLHWQSDVAMQFRACHARGSFETGDEQVDDGYGSAADSNLENSFQGMGIAAELSAEALLSIHFALPSWYQQRVPWIDTRFHACQLENLAVGPVERSIFGFTRNIRITTAVGNLLSVPHPW